MEVNLTIIANWQVLKIVPLKIEPFQPINMPLEAPFARAKVNLLNLFGAILRTKE
jgi:hypothetical protein